MNPSVMRKPYSLKILWHGRNRFLPAILAVSFSAVLIAVQSGVLLGTLAVTSRPIDHAGADIWVGIRDMPSIELGHPIPEAWLYRLQAQPEVEEVEGYLYEFAYWHKPGGGSEHCCIIGARLDRSSLGAVADLTPEMRTLLTEPGAVVVDKTELARLGLQHGVGEQAEIMGHKVRVVGLVSGFKSIWGPYVFCSLQTARMLLTMYQPDQIQYLLAHCQRREDVPAVVERLQRKYPEMSILARHDFSLQTRLYWLTRTRIGIALGLTSILALIVGLVITSQTLYAATAASLREYAVLRALGLPRWRIGSLVVAQSFWIGLGGVAASVPAALLLGRFAGVIGAEVQLPAWLLAATITTTMIIALVSGLLALRSLRLVEPAHLLR
jgi:putative ABC transport system permease protein